MEINKTDLIKIASKRMNLPEDQLLLFIDLYYEKLQKDMRNLKHNCIYVPGLGDFMVGINHVKDKIKKYEYLIKRSKERGASDKNIESKQKTLDDCRNVLEMIEKEEKRKKEIYDERHKNW